MHFKGKQMTENQLKVSLGITLVASHFGIIVLLIILFSAGGFKFEDLTTAVAIIVPMFAGYSTSVTTFVVKNRHKNEDKSPEITMLYAIMSFVFPAVFTFLLVASVVSQSFGKIFANFEQFKQALVLLEGVFAIYIGRFVYSMFERPEEQVTASNGNDHPIKIKQ
jgi:hypothetical protein